MKAERNSESGMEMRSMRVRAESETGCTELGHGFLLPSLHRVSLLQSIVDPHTSRTSSNRQLGSLGDYLIPDSSPLSAIKYRRGPIMDIVGSVASIGQLIDFSTQLILRIKEYSDVHGDLPRAFLDISARLPLFLIEIESLKEWLDSDTARGLTPDHITALGGFISRCRDVIERLRELQDAVLVKPGDSKLRRVGKALLSIQKDKVIQNEWKRLESHHVALFTCYKSLRKLAPSHLPPGPASPPIIYEVRAQRTSFFVSRPGILRCINEQFTKPTPSSITKIVVLLGLGGQGKTQMALEYCRIQKTAGLQRAIFWIDSSSPDSLRRGYRAIATRVQPGMSFKNDDEAVEFTVQYLANWERPWLIILDNLDRPDEMANLREYLPQSSVGNILITSRHEATKELGSSILLDAMEEKEALELLLRCMSSDAVDMTLPAAKLVIERLGYLPLAIDHARAYITLRQLTFDDFLREYELRKDIVMKASPTLSEYRRSQGSIKNRNTLSVFTTWEMSLEQLLGSVEHPDGIREALQLIGSFYPRGISETLLSAYALDDDKDTETPMTYFIKDGAWDHEKFETLVIWMKTLSLLQFTRLATGEISLIFHPLVAEWLVVKGGRLGIDLVARLSALHVACYATTFSDLGLTGFSLRQQLLTQMNHVFPKMLLLLPNRLLQRIGYLYQELGHWKEAEEMYDRALAGYEKQLGSEHPSTLMTINSLGLLYRDLGRLLEAEQMFNKALIGYEKVFGPDNTETVTIMNNLGIVYRDLGRLSEAEQPSRDTRKHLGQKQP
jgi:tetratricopeptide (TPR) repeat protein